MRLRLTKAGRKIVRTSPRRSLIGAFEIRNSVGAILSFRINIDLGARKDVAPRNTGKWNTFHQHGDFYESV